ncbi:hypothetical protein EXIGLDRAFT_570603, partial [Exidia glandulosa HHB12029]
DIRGVVRTILQRYRYNKDQERAFGLLAEHRLTESEQQLFMFIVGSAGTGKSHIIRGLEDLFRSIDAKDELRKTAPTGCASFLILTETLHAMLMIYGRYLDDIRGPQLEALQVRWRGVKYLAIDEVSMVGAVLNARTSKRLQL